MSLPALAIGAVVGGGLLGAAGKVKEGNAQYQQAMYQAQVSQRNQQLADIDAAEAIKDGQVQETAIRRQTAQTEGTQRATLAALGQELNIGGAADILNDTAQLGETDALTARRNAQKEALGFTLKGLDFQSDATMQQAAGKNARSAGFLSAAGTLLSTAGSAASMGVKFKGGG